jgi:MFS family permease
MSSDAKILAPRASLGRAGPDPRRWAALVVMLLAAFMNLLDVSIVNIAIPPIQRGLHASYADVQWALAGYALAYALFLITGGRLGDSFGRKRLFLTGVIGFTIMSALCGAAQSAGMLIASRVGQGAMGALMIPQVLSAIQVMFPAAERIKALAAFGVTAGLGAVSGPLLGGLLTSHDLLGLGWRSIFMINIPVGVIAVAASLVLVRESRAPRPPRLDPVGFTPLHAGATFIPFSLGLFVASGAAARLEPRFGRGVTMSGALIIAGGMAALIGIVHHYGAATSTWEMVPALAAAGLGLGTVIAPLANVVLAGVPEQDAGSASGVLNTGFQLGNSIGIALMGVVFIDRLAVRPGASVPGVFAGAVTHALWYQVGAFALAFLLMLALPGRRSHTDGASAVKEMTGRARGIPARRNTTEEC